MRNYKIKRACQYVYEYITSTTGKYQEILTLLYSETKFLTTKI